MKKSALKDCKHLGERTRRPAGYIFTIEVIEIVCNDCKKALKEEHFL